MGIRTTVFIFAVAFAILASLQVSNASSQLTLSDSVATEKCETYEPGCGRDNDGPDSPDSPDSF